ncbi:NADPH:quinone reductase-like Zn-dependent oxidoreductase [Rhizobium pisi]|uniref:NAD(P)-dependent alcohol dehydrogenase n=1 Tax=Rhizobium pisi TaxID=574561 RepID=A0A3R9BZ32_9HYPH|nr:NAD(P)-dependent alcohol dehydrogenase [Rhizobium pisi]MBB3138296.1 NADPH:quinone reductase-like Zn-dependent oxidoreductase [Rhizobium pisi]RSB63458.1 NAD(P)-dependent alcohol dehydrogenase [Rhizobium pisi]TCA43480.1 NAD(P)-dependent alcohol dehydrogenase [Rhizobium pisi]
MKRVQYDRYGGPEKMYFGECDVPRVGDGEVRVSVKAAAINPFDWKLRQGAMKLVTGRRFPKAMGTDFAGLVEAAGRNVGNVTVGDEVFGTVDFKKSGAFAEAVVVKADHVAKKPPQLSFAEAASLPIAAMTAWAAVIDRAQARPGARIFINGCSGAVGAFAVQLAISRGAHVAGACGPASRDSARAAGVAPIFAYSDSEAYARGGTYDAVFDTLGTLDVGHGLSMLNPRGVFVDINPTPGRLLRGMLSRRYKLAFATMGIKRLPEIAELAASGTLRPAIGLEAPFTDALSVIADAETGRRTSGKTVLTF